MAEHLTPEKIEQLTMRLINRLDGITTMNSDQRAVSVAAIRATLVEAAELGMAWREQAEAAREWINHPDHFNTDEGATDGQSHVAYINACKRTDQLTGRIGTSTSTP